MSGLEEILFENRNKKYGAYQLRKKANKYRTIGFLVSLGIMVITSVALFIILNADLFFPEKYSTNISIESMQMADLHDFLYPEPPKALEKAANDLDKPLEVDSTQEEKKKAEATNKNATANDSITKKGLDTPEDGVGASLHGDSLYLIVEKRAEYIGGKAELNKFLIKNLAEISRRNKVRMNVIVQFTVTKFGTVRDVAIVSGGNPDVNKDIIRVISMLNSWIPAQQSGHRVSYRISYLINL